jgi:hypothetical protein
MMKPILHSRGLPYFQRVKNVFGPSLFAYYPLWEAEGSVAYDISGHAFHGAYTNILLGQAGIGDQHTAPYFDGTAYVTLPAGFRSAFDYSKGTILWWQSIDDPDIWMDASFYRPWAFGDSDGSDYIRAYKNGQYNDMTVSYRFAGATSIIIEEEASTIGFIPLAFTWSRANNRTRLYIYNHLCVEGTYSEDVRDAMTKSFIGCDISVGTACWIGRLAHVAIGNVELPGPKLLTLFNTPASVITVQGDSICTNSNSWTARLILAYPSKAVLFCHAYTGESIMSHMDAQTVAAANDDADIIILSLGTNDNNAGDMNALQAEVEENIAELKATNPRARLFYLNVLPRWVDNSTGAEVNKSAIRAAIAAACTAQGIPCWDPYTTPWITQDQTVDGLHPNSDGHISITTHIQECLA